MTTTTNMPDGSIARKVGGATLGAGSGTIVANLLLWLLDEYIFGPGTPNDVPDPVAAFVIFAVATALAFAGGYFTKRGIEETIVLPDQALAALPLSEKIKADAAQRLEDAEAEKLTIDLAGQPGIAYVFAGDGKVRGLNDDDELEGHGDEMGEDDEVVDGPEDDPDPIDPDAR